MERIIARAFVPWSGQSKRLELGLSESIDMNTMRVFSLDSWERPYVLTPPAVWFYEVFRHDDTPYRENEVDLIRQLPGRSIAGQQLTLRP